MNNQGFDCIAKTLLFLLFTFALPTAQASGIVVNNLNDGNGVASLFAGTVTQTGPMDSVISLDINHFVAGTAGTGGLAGVGPDALDILFMTLVAPTGYAISSVSYAEHGNIETTNGFAVAGGSLVADGIASNLLSVIAGPGSVFQTWDIGPVVVPINNKQTIDVSFTNSLVASTFGGIGDIARVEKSSAILTVGLTAVPLPPAIWLLGIAFAGLLSIGRRGDTAAQSLLH